MNITDPLCKLQCIGDGGREEDIVYVVRQENQSLLPHNTSLYRIQHRINYQLMFITLIARLQYYKMLRLRPKR